MRILRVLGIAGLVLVGIGVALGVAARFSDGPLGPIAGGPLRSGEWVTDPEPDFSFLRDVPEVEFQLLEPARSRTTWIVHHDGEIYIPCGFVGFSLWKQWPREAVKDGRGVLRIHGRRYPVQATRVTDMELFEALYAKVFEKYPWAPEGARPDPEAVWIFRLDPRGA